MKTLLSKLTSIEMSAGKSFFNSARARLYGLRDGDGVRAMLLLDADADARFAVDDGRVPDVVEAVFHPRDILDADVGAYRWPRRPAF